MYLNWRVLVFVDGEWKVESHWWDRDGANIQRKILRKQGKKTRIERCNHDILRNIFTWQPA